MIRAFYAATRRARTILRETRRGKRAFFASAAHDLRKGRWPAQCRNVDSKARQGREDAMVSLNLKCLIAAGSVALALAGCTTTVVSPGPGPYDPVVRPGPYDGPGPYDSPGYRPPRNEPPVSYRPPRTEPPVSYRPPRNEPPVQYRPPRDEIRGACNANRVRDSIGSFATPGRLEQVAAQSGARVARVVRPGMMVTQDFSPDRITVVVGRTNRIESLSCG